MKTTLTSNWRPLLRALYAFLITIAVLWAMPRNAHAQLYVTQGNIVSEYDAKTGAAINPNFIAGLSSPFQIVLLGNTLFVSNLSGTIGEYDAKTGASISAGFITGLNEPVGLVLLGNTLFVANFGGGTIGEYDAKTGAAINANFVTGLNSPFGIAVKSAK
jgi:hypothetical protein